MNDYTVKVCDILESVQVPIINPENPWLIKGIDEIISDGMDYFFSFEFPWYTEKTDLSLYDFKNLFLHKNYLESIGQENFAQFQLVLQSKLMEVMPRYTELYKTIKIEYDPLINRFWKNTRNEKGSGNSNTTGNSTTSGNSVENLQQDTQDVHSRNPEISVATQDFASEMDRGQKKNENTASTNVNGTTESNSNSSYTNNVNEDKEGFEGESQTDNILKYRKAILNLNQMLCDELHPVCFLHYYGGTYFRNEDIR